MSDKNKNEQIDENLAGLSECQDTINMQLELQKLLIGISSSFINLPLDNISSVISTSLRDLGLFVGADRVYIFDYNFQREICVNTYEWCSEGIEAGIDNLQDVPFSALQEWLKKHLDGESINIPDVNALPPGLRRDILESQGIQSLLTVPMMNAGECIGFVGFDSVRKKRVYTENEQFLISMYTIMLVNIELRIKSEEARKQAKDDWENTFNSLTDMVTIHDKDFNIISANKNARDFLSLSSSDELICTKCFACYHGTDKPPEGCPGCRSMETLQPCTEEIYEPHLNKYLEVRANPRFDINHNCIGLIHVVRDITESKLAQDALYESEERYRSILEASPDDITITDNSGKIILISPQAVKMFGYNSVDDGIGKFITDFIIPEDRERAKGNIALKMQGVKTGPIEYVGIHADGSFIELESNSEVIRDADGNPSGMVFVVRDITERKKAEQALRESEERFKRAFKYSPIGVGLLSPQGKWLMANDSITSTIGYTEDELLLMTFMDITCPDDLDESLKFVSMALNGDIDSFTMDKWYCHKDGHLIWASLVVALIRNDSGDPLNFIAQIVDITERRRAEEERAKLEDQLRQSQKMESVGRLAGGVAHDFNNMLQAILGNADMAKEMLPEDSPAQESIEEICIAAEHSADLTRQLLAFARKQTVAPKVINLNETVSGMIKMLIRLIGEDINLDWKPGDNLWHIKVDPSQIDQILANLSVNARDAISGIGKISIETENISIGNEFCNIHSDFTPGDYVTLTVTDSGCGMDDETMSHLFEPFFTTKGIGKGTGLGLATVYGAVKQNNGNIIVTSKVGEGTSFVIYLSKYEDKISHVVIDGIEVPHQKGKETILLVEDEKSILKLTTMMLEHLGYNVLPANNPVEAIQIADDYRGEINLVMTDVIMPEMNGRDLARRIINMYPDMKCLFMSGYTSDAIANRGVIDSGIYFLQKPFSIKELSTRVHEALGK